MNYGKNNKSKNKRYNQTRKTHTLKQCNNKQHCPIHGRSLTIKRSPKQFITGRSHSEHYQRAFKHGREGISSLALGLAEQALKELNVEYKTASDTLDITPDNVPVITNICDPSQGDDSNNRNGDKIKATSIQIKGVACGHGSATSSVYRVLIFEDRSGTTTPPVITDLFGSAAVFYDLRAKRQEADVNSRFNIIKDWCFEFQNTGKQCSKMSWYKKLNHHIYFSGTSSSDEGRGSLWMITSSNQPTNTPTVQADVFVKFIDN